MTTVRQGEPRGELAGSFVGRVPVEGHHSAWHAGAAEELRAPTVADGPRFDQVRAPANGLFVAMNVHVAMEK
jgi:hypothetical protein